MKEDARVIRTKEKLFGTFIELLSKKTFEEITVNEICRLADIRRATFYKHFSDKYDFLAGLTRYLRRNFECKFDEQVNLSKLDKSEYYFEYLRAVIEFINKNEAIINLIFDSNISATLVSVVVEENYIRTKEKLDEDVKNGLKLIASPDTVAIYVAGGISNAIIKWLRMGKPIPSEQLIEELGAILFTVFVK